MIYHPWRRFPLAVTLLASAAASIACTLRPSPADGSASTRSAPLPSASAQALLFTYRRDDTAPGQVTRIRINAARVAASPIQQNVFGNFVEHLGGVVYEGIWAQVLLNPNLERIEERDPEPAAWNLTGGAWQEGGYLSPRCVRLADADDALSQRIFLPTHRTRKYSLTLYARTPQGAGQMTLTLRRGEGLAGPVALKVPVNVAPSGDGRWEKRTLRWQLPAGALTQGEPARFSLTHSGGKAIDVDQIEVFPDDAVNGMDPDVIAKARAWRIPLLRYPGGNFVSGYHWRDGVGPRAQRPTRRNPAWGGIEPNHFGTDEFLDFARRIGATAHFCVNAGDGTPEEAAAWVRYCNAKSLRVPVWEIGNELYGGWQIGHTDAAGNAARFVRFRDAMLKADPRIKIIATGRGDEFQPEGLARGDAWNEAVLRAAAQSGARLPEWLSAHPLVPLPGDLHKMPYADQYESAMAHPAFLDRTLLPTLIRRIRSLYGSDAPTRIALTEWGIIVGGDRWWESPNHDVQRARSLTR